MCMKEKPADSTPTAPSSLSQSTSRLSRPSFKRRIVSSIVPLSTRVHSNLKQSASNHHLPTNHRDTDTDTDTAPSSSAPPTPSTPIANPFPVTPSSIALIHPHLHSLWYLHIIVLPHNAIKAEVIDLLAMLPCVNPRNCTLVREWYTLFNSFLQTYLNFEISTLFPWIYKDHDADTDIASFKQTILADRQSLLDSLRNIDTLPFHNVPALVHLVGVFVNALLTYLKRQQRVLPNLIQSSKSKTQTLYIEKLMAQALNVELLLRWIPGFQNRFRLKLQFQQLGILSSWKNRQLILRHTNIVRSIVDEANHPPPQPPTPATQQHPRHDEKKHKPYISNPSLTC